MLYEEGCCLSFGHVGSNLLLQTLSETVVEEEELSVRKQAVEQNINAVALQQDLSSNTCDLKTDAILDVNCCT